MAEQSRKTEWVAVSVVEIDVRHRPTHPDAVDRIADSMARIGMRTPISVRADRTRSRPECPDERYVLVTGAHRLAAARLLGWEQIECFKVDCDELDAELWEIAENLHRAELTALQRDEQVARWIELADKKQKVSSQLAKKPQGGRPEGGITAASRALGIDKDDAHRATKVAALSNEAKEAAREVGLDDNRTALLKAAKESTPEKQAAVIRNHAEQRTGRSVPKPADQTCEEWLAEGKRWWSRGTLEWKKAFVAQTNDPHVLVAGGVVEELRQQLEEANRDFPIERDRLVDGPCEEIVRLDVRSPDATERGDGHGHIQTRAPTAAVILRPRPQDVDDIGNIPPFLDRRTPKRGNTDA